MGETMDTKLIIKALRQALIQRSPPRGLMHHSDQGSQYTSHGFKEFAQQHGLVLSMSHKGCCYDNAVAESFFHTLKTEYVYLCGEKSREAMMCGIFEYIEAFYNRKRAHSTLNYSSPEEFEAMWSQCPR